MSIKTIIGSGDGTEITAKVDNSRALCVIENPFPPFGVNSGMRIFRQYLTDDGTSTGSNDMAVDGSSTNVEFWVQADPDKDRYITSLSFVIADAGADANQFGNITALSNGCQLEYEDTLGVVTIHEALTTNFEFVRLCQGSPAFGTGASAFRVPNVAGNSEAYIPVLDLREVFGFKWGINLQAGTDQKLVLRIRDNVSGIDQFDCIAYGFDREDTGIHTRGR